MQESFKRWKFKVNKHKQRTNKYINTKRDEYVNGVYGFRLKYKRGIFLLDIIHSLLSAVYTYRYIYFIEGKKKRKKW